MKRITEKEKSAIKSLAKSGIPRKEIADQLQLKMSTVNYILKPVAEKVHKVKKEKVKKEIIDENAKDDRSDMDHEAWAGYWKDRYLHLHVQLLENNIEPLPYL